MDIFLLESRGKVDIKPTTIHGLLWLQIHFECENWEAIVQNKAVISKKDAEFLIEDASEAGLNVNLIPAVKNLQKFS